MKRFSFSLESVLTLRRFRKTQAAGVLAENSRLRLVAARILEEGKARLAEIEDSLRTAIAPRATVGEIVMIQQALREQHKAVKDLHEAYITAVEKEGEARQAVLDAQRKYEAMLKLEASQREAFRKEVDREDEKVMQEFVSAQHIMLRGR